MSQLTPFALYPNLLRGLFESAHEITRQHPLEPQRRSHAALVAQTQLFVTSAWPTVHGIDITGARSVLVAFLVKQTKSYRKSRVLYSTNYTQLTRGKQANTRYHACLQSIHPAKTNSGNHDAPILHDSKKSKTSKQSINTPCTNSTGTRMASAVDSTQDVTRDPANYRVPSE